MRLYSLIFISLFVFKVDTFPVSQVTRRPTKEYEVFKNILIQNLIVTTDNLKLILNWERDYTSFQIQDGDIFSTKITNCNGDNIFLPLQHETISENDLSEKNNDEEEFNDKREATDDIPSSFVNFDLSKYSKKRSHDTEADPEKENKTGRGIKNNLDEDKVFEIKKREAKDDHPIDFSDENLLNYANFLELGTAPLEYDSMKDKRQAGSGGDSPLPIPTGDGETQMFMGTFQAVMRPMKLPVNGYLCSMQSLSPTECIVSGTLSLVLRMSKLAGVAPLSFKRSRDGFSVRVSLAASCYGHILSFILWTLSTSTIALDICIHPEKSYRTRSNSTRIVWVADVGTVGLVMCVAAFTGLRRMRCLTACLLQLHEINVKLNLYHEKPTNERRRMLLVVGSMTFTITTILLDYGLFIYQVITEQEKVIISCMYIFYNISTIIGQVVFIMFSQIATSVLTSIQMLNKCLKSLRQEIQFSDTSYNHTIKEKKLNLYDFSSHKSINNVIDTMAVYKGQIPSVKTIPHRIHRIALLYCSICDILRQISESHGLILMALLLSLLLHLVITPYHIITNIFNKSRSDGSNLFVQLSWAVLHFSNLLLIVEPCHRTYDEMELTKQLVSQMTRYSPSDNDALISELKMFYRHLILNETDYAPMKMLSLNRSLIVTILGSITTYLVVMIQL